MSFAAVEVPSVRIHTGQMCRSYGLSARRINPQANGSALQLLWFSLTWLLLMVMPVSGPILMLSSTIKFTMILFDLSYHTM
jgi:hypothetical protein